MQAKRIPIDAEHVARVKLRAAHKRGEHEHLFVDECPECQADADVLRGRGRAGGEVALPREVDDEADDENAVHRWIMRQERGA